MSATITTMLGTSNLRGSSRQTRTNPTRTSKTVGSSLRQNSLISNPPASALGVGDPHGFYPAIADFADAITALPRDYRRHTSLLKEVDAKAWAPEETLQALLSQCLVEKTAPLTTTNGQTATGSTANATDEAAIVSTAASVNGAALEVASQYSTHSADPAAFQRRQVFGALRHNLMQIMVTMDEKNHVINNANEELSRHIRRLDSIWPAISDEISEEARLGSLKHWAYTETNPSSKKTVAPTSRREAAASLAIMHDNDIAHRSESRREAMLAKKQRMTQHVDSDLEEARPTSRKAIGSNKRRAADGMAETAGLGIAGASKRKRPDKALGGIGMERSLSSALAGGRAMSREPSQQENTKKRKAPAVASTMARKRLNASAQDSPKLASSPLAGSFGKDAYKRSPALSSVRPVSSRARQNSTQNLEHGRVRPSSSASHRNANGNSLSVTTSELNNLSAMTGKSASEVKSTMKETTTNKGERLLEEDMVGGANGDVSVRGGLLLERSASKQGGAKGEARATDDNLGRSVASPRLPTLVTSGDMRWERGGRGRASKTSTPIVGTFADAESGDSGNNGNGHGKLKRPARPRMKDHGLHDSLSPKGLPQKRSHKKGAGMTAQQLASQRLKDEVEHASGLLPEGEIEEEEEENGLEDEERYCYCQGVSYGEMVACDNKDCVREWFHLDCIGLKSVPKSAKWYCDECKENVKKGNGNGNGR